jgi:hypothetical protein
MSSETGTPRTDSTATCRPRLILTAVGRAFHGLWREVYRMRAARGTEVPDWPEWPRPHIRRAHWHTYRIGKGRAERRMRWLAPVAVKLADPDGLAANVRPVRPKPQ